MGEEKNKKPKKTVSTRRLRWRLTLKIFLLFFLVCCVGGLSAIVVANKYFEKKTDSTIADCVREAKEIAATSKREDFLSDKATKIYSSDDKLIATLYENKENTYLTYDKIPENVVNAFIAIEDRSFRTNTGIDYKGMVRALYYAVKSGGEDITGASTITQQLARQKYLTLDRTISRKIKEIFLAQELTKMYSKDDIMEFYVNTCCFANAVYGIQDASLRYFNKPVDQLSLSEIAYLCAIPNWPEYYNPLKNPENAIERRDKILHDMVTCGFITKTECDKAIAEDIKIYRGEDEEEPDYNYETTYAVNCATRYLMGQGGFEFEYSWNSDAEFKAYRERYSDAYDEAKHKLYTGGYTIYTTIDTDAQREMQAVLDEVLSGEEERLDSGIYKIQGAMTVIDNETDKVVAVIGGRSQDEIKGNFTLNRAYQGWAQPGSCMKPLVVYTPAMESEEYFPNKALKNIDVKVAYKLTGPEIEKLEGKPVFLRKAVENSLNGCAYWLSNEVGPQTGAGYLQRMGFEKITPSDYTLSTALGGLTYGTTTEEMANAYSTLENSGLYKDADCIKSILDRDGVEIYQESEPVRIYERDAADAMTDVLKGVLTKGTAWRSNWYSYTSTEAAGKTGTTNDNKAAWFCGYTPYYSIAVWIGCDTPTEVYNLTGSSYPLEVWQKAMLTMIEDLPTATLAELPASKNIKVYECTCEIQCDKDHINPECKACSQPGVDLAMTCVADPQECKCKNKCVGDDLDEECPVCIHDITRCVGVEPECICTSKCSPTSVNPQCVVCMRDSTVCKSEKELVCTCTTKCSETSVNPLCEACRHDKVLCLGSDNPSTEVPVGPSTSDPPSPPPVDPPSNPSTGEPSNPGEPSDKPSDGEGGSSDNNDKDEDQLPSLR